MRKMYASRKAGAALRTFAAVIVLVVAVAFIGSTIDHKEAYADGSAFTLQFVPEGEVPDTIQTGDTFTVSAVLNCNTADSYAMYALGSTIRYQSSVLQLKSVATENGILEHEEEPSGWKGFTDIKLNFLSSATNGTAWSNPVKIVTMTFEALKQGSTTLMIRAINISDTTGMKFYTVDAKDLSVTISNKTTKSEESATGGETSEGDPSEGEKQGEGESEGEGEGEGEGTEQSGKTDGEKSEEGQTEKSGDGDKGEAEKSGDGNKSEGTEQSEESSTDGETSEDNPAEGDKQGEGESEKSGDGGGAFKEEENTSVGRDENTTDDAPDAAPVDSDEEDDLGFLLVIALAAVGGGGISVLAYVITKKIRNPKQAKGVHARR